ncbi:MAG: hypothetical protein JJD97_13080 [Gemmatimonadaceae bacterium]|nr:hypothetical protein [Gemmatimonadaceae bacterium]
MTHRESIGAGILFLWLVGLALLARRELWVSEPEQMMEAALLVVPGTAYYEVMDGDARVGWASSSIDTSVTGISVRDVMVIDPPDSGPTKRFAARARVSLTPALRLTSFAFELGGGHGAYRVTGKMRQDTLLTLVTSAGKARPDTATVAVRRAVFWPTTVPLALALAARPKVGRTYKYSIYDPTTGTPEDVQLVVGAESLFVVPDSAKLDEARASWVVAHADTVRGWRLDPQGSTLLSGWIDERGRAIETKPTGTFTLRRTAYELAFQNWTLDAKRSAAAKKAHHIPTNR